jgi:hypothetical protein
MGLLDAMVGRCFRDETAGRVVVFPSDRRGRGYLLRSAAEEQKVRSFLKLYLCAHFPILLLGYGLAYAISVPLVYALDRPAAHILRSAFIFSAVFGVIAGIPYLLFWRTYLSTRMSFVAAQDEIEVVGTPPLDRRVLVFAAVAALFALIALGVVFFLVRAK